MLGFLTRRPPCDGAGLLDSKLLNEETFYPAFLKDLKDCHTELVIECPFVTNRRLTHLLPSLEKLKAHKVRVVIVTRDPRSHDDNSQWSGASDAISRLQHLGVHVIYKENHHRKIAIIDRQVLYEGSLNILSQSNSCEIMRRICSTRLAWQTVRFTGIDKLF